MSRVCLGNTRALVGSGIAQGAEAERWSLPGWGVLGTASWIVGVAAFAFAIRAFLRFGVR